MTKSVFTGQEISEDNPYASLGAGVGFSNPYAVEAMGPLERQEQYTAEHLQSFVEKVDDDSVTADDLFMTARAFIDGMWLNKGEEVSSYISAAVVKILQPEAFRDVSVSELREQILTDEEAKSAQFAEESPYLSAGANIAGSIVSPVSIKGGQLLTQANKLRQSAQAATTQSQVAATLGTGVAQSADEGAQLATQLLREQSGSLLSKIRPDLITPTELLSKAPTVLGASALALGEGAVIGYEGQTDEEKFNNALITAGISSAVPFAFAGVKKGYDVFTESKLAQQLGEGKDFINLMFTDHPWAGVYRSVVSKAYGGRTLSEQQARQMAGRAVTTASAKAEANKTTSEAARKTASAKASIKRNTEEAIEETGIRIDSQIEELRKLAREAKGEAQLSYEKQIEELELAKQSAGSLRAVAVKDADEATNSANAFFRGQALREAAPPGATADEINELGMMDPQDANAFLDGLWKKYGFTVANGKTYEIDSDGVIKFIDSIEDDFSDLALVGGESANIVARVKTYITEQIAKNAPNGVISGEDLVQLRSTIGRAISGLSDGATSTRRFASEVQTYFDDLLEEGLSKEEVATLAADKTAWSIRSIVDGAIAKASDGKARAGAFDASDYLSALRSFSTRFTARGQGRLQQEAQDLAKVTERNKENIIDLANREAGDVAKQAIKDRSALKQSLEKQRTKIQTEADEQIAELKRQKQVQGATAQGKQAIDLKIAEVRERVTLQLADVDSKIARAKQELNALKELMPSSFQPSVFESLFNSALVGQAAGLFLPRTRDQIGSTVITGSIASRILAEEVTQRLLAGQTAGQAAIRSGMSAVGDVAEKIGATTAMTTGGQAAVAGQLAVPQGVMFSKERKEAIRKMPISGKAALYRNLKSKDGSLERLKAEDPKLLKELELANKRGK
jgi:hypothetical protein